MNHISDEDLRELETVLGRLALGNIIERRRRGHKKISDLERFLKLKTALEIAEDAA